MRYEVLEDFRDLITSLLYHAGDDFPRVGTEATEERIKELSTSKNRMGRPLIGLIKPTEQGPKEEAPKRRKKKGE